MKKYLILVLCAIYLSGCATTNRTKTLGLMFGVGAGSAALGYATAPQDEKAGMHAVYWGAIGAAAAGVLGLFIFDEEKRADEAIRQNEAMKKSWTPTGPRRVDPSERVEPSSSWRALPSSIAISLTSSSATFAAVNGSTAAFPRADGTSRATAKCPGLAWRRFSSSRPVSIVDPLTPHLVSRVRGMDQLSRVPDLWVRHLRREPTRENLCPIVQT